MKSSTTIEDLFQGNQIKVPAYQRSYSWDTEFDQSKSSKQVNTFLSDLEEYSKTNSKIPYYFGHFLFEKTDNNVFNVVDGQQRMTTIVIFIAVLFKRLKELKKVENVEGLSKEQFKIYQNIIKRQVKYVFTTVDYDERAFKDYIIDQIKVNDLLLKTESARRFVNAFKFFEKHLSVKNEKELLKLLNILKNASCTTHTVRNESEAIQMFIFQNNRGKKPSTLEIIKAEFIFHVHLYANDTDRKDLIEEIRQRFEVIYEAISSIEYKIHEDDVLKYTVRYFFNKLWEDNPQERIQKSLTDKTLSIKFIQDFTADLAESFEYLKQFFNIDEKKSHVIHSIISLGQIGVAIPFILKSYFFNLNLSEREKLCSALEIILLRHRLIGTRADIISRLTDVYEKFNRANPSIMPIIERIEYLKEPDHWWYSYWNNEVLENALNNRIQYGTAKYLLWKYENYLESQEKKGYQFRRYDAIIAPELEHIAPQTPKNNERVASGYPEYDDEFKSEYLNCLGNYLLISKSHNSSIGNSNFKSKRDSYEKSPLAQQREVFTMTVDRRKWSKVLIKKRHEKIVNFLLASI
ncbi:DUF262 domain-containing protein [Bisgaard Taxon 45]